MSKQIGFVILSHNNPRQLLRLVRCLQRIYDNPPIAIHHDRSQSPLHQDEFPSDIKFVTPHVKTRWGQFSVVIAALRALELLYQNAPPDWFVLLSAADYPTMAAAKVVTELTSSGVDTLLDYRETPNLSASGNMNRHTLKISRYAVDVGAFHFDQAYPPAENPTLKHFTFPRVAWRRYVGFSVWFPVI